MNNQQIKIFLPQPIWSAGKRSTNEDYVYPLPTELSENQQLFIVCDGVGGTQKGGIASKLACEQFVRYYQQQQKPTLTPELLRQAIIGIQQCFDAYILSDKQAQKMGTTFALLQIQAQKIIIAHIGDSRIYHIRKGKILFVTRDHSYVNQLIDKGELDEADAINHPYRNIITRAIQAESMGRIAPSICLVEDIQPYDYFFICTDGIQEGVKQWQLLSILADDTKDNADKNRALKQLCEQNSTDNYAAFLIQIKTVAKTVTTV